MKKIISIIIATYNAEKTLKRCLSSIIAQKNDQLELLIIDGGSVDRTMDIVKDASQSIDVIVSEPDKGLYDAWNKALRLATGEWIMFLGADDYLLEGAIDEYWNYLKTHTWEGVDIITAQSQLIDGQGKYLRILGNPYNIKEFRRYMKISHGSTLHNRTLFDELGDFNLSFKICADYEFLLRKNLNAGYIETPTIAMQIGGMSNTIIGLWESFQVKRYRRSIPLPLNVYYLIKGIIGYYMRKARVVN
ncbi:glycosyltransferase family 2 protein [Bacteroides xylanisolvens]|uniref:glycosyltransferase family 2 protein n=1 Tax=Bacteroides xylanisolvens TaxID=371601 RepID=UPI001F5ADEF2|nr:glycosyltransferase family 2 protein [Bacteroides xylanisolvens]